MPLIDCKAVQAGNKKIGGGLPTIVTSAYGKSADDFIESFKNGKRNESYLYEIRYDLFKSRNLQDAKRILDFLNDRSVDYIFTFRSEETDLALSYYEVASRCEATAVDIEFSVWKEIQDKGSYKTLILSYHSFDGNSILAHYKEISSAGSDVIKLASTYNKFDSYNEDLLGLKEMKARDRKCLAFVPMGRNNAFLRVFSGYVLSDLVYAKEDTETAEGQLTRGQYENFFSSF